VTPHIADMDGRGDPDRRLFAPRNVTLRVSAQQPERWWTPCSPSLARCCFRRSYLPSV